MLFAVYVQDLNPLGNRVLSTLVAALPVLVLFYLLVGRRWLASWAGAAGAVVAILLAWLVYGMPLDMAGWSFVHGAVFGLLPIGWTVFDAMLLYNITVETGQFAIIRRSIGGLSGDARVQAVLIGFCFGAFLEGAAGAGSPVAICGAMLVGLGVPPFRAAVICLIANTSPVCYGGLGVPILTLASVTGISGRHDQRHVRAPAPVPVVPDPAVHGQDACVPGGRRSRSGRRWSSAAGRSRVFQYFFATAHAYGLPADLAADRHRRRHLLAGRAGHLPEVRLEAEGRVEVPGRPGRRRADGRARDRRTTRTSAEAAGAGRDAARQRPAMAEREEPLTAGSVILAWSPWVIMSVFLVVTGFVRQQEKTEPTTWRRTRLRRAGADAAQRGRANYVRSRSPTLHKAGASEPTR